MNRNPRIPSPTIDDSAHSIPTRRSMITSAAVVLASPTAAASAVLPSGALTALDSTRSPLIALHARWAVLKAEHDGIQAKVDETMHENCRRGWPFVAMEEGCVFDAAQIDAVIDQRPVRSAVDRARIERQRGAYKAALAADQADFEAASHRLGIKPLVQRYAEIPPLIEELLDEIYAAPIETVVDVAVILDVAMGECEIDITGEAIHEDAASRLVFTTRLLRELMRAAPGFEFTTLRRELLPDQFAAFLAEPEAA